MVTDTNVPACGITPWSRMLRTVASSTWLGSGAWAARFHSELTVGRYPVQASTASAAHVTQSGIAASDAPRRHHAPVRHPHSATAMARPVRAIHHHSNGGAESSASAS
jgi:hypothetical protein